MREPRVRRRLSRILKEVKTECGDSDASSDDDGQSVLSLLSRPDAANFLFKFLYKRLWTLISISLYNTCRHFIMGSSSPIAYVSDARCLAPSSAQPLHPRHEDYWWGISPIPKGCYTNGEYNVSRHFFIFVFTEGIELGERDLKSMLHNHREKRKRQPVSKKNSNIFSLDLHKIALMADLFRITRTWWPLISTSETYFLERILVGRVLWVSKVMKEVCVIKIK